MNKMECIFVELLKMLSTAKTFIKKLKDSIKRKNFNQVKCRMKKGKVSKSNDKGKSFYYGRDGHWKRNYKAYFSNLKVKPKENCFECILIIEINISISHSTI